ncbi:exportin-2 [Elaeis guineensis]|uniref:Exportin-2 n=1 Tax=Elaeis guineensis var. tenera TaxID=51953 RepID=A0A6I9R0D5_ELAGV|nr:exportin-2 [Elaeis guineensis]
MDFNNPAALETLSQWFLQSLSPDPEPRRRAESSLSAAAASSGFALAVLNLVATDPVDEQIRLAAAVHFKNHLRSRWSPSSSDDLPIPEAEKNQIKALIVSLMLKVPRRIRPQLSEALSIISSHDFPQAWPSLLPELVSNLRSAADYSTVNGLLGAANSLFLKFRHSFDTPALRLDLKYCLDGFAAPLLEVFLKTAQLISASATAGSPDVLCPLFESQRLCCEIFHSLNSIELPEFFEDHMREWMTEFRNYLTATYSPAVEAEGTVDALRAAICENLQLYMEKNEEEFKDYLKDFASAVWNLLTTSAAITSRDQLTITAIKFLTTVSTSVHHSLFGSPEALQQICESIVFPNIQLREEDEELFEMNYIEYIRRDIEGSDIDTRRRIACELLKGIALNYKEQVTAQVSMQIQRMLALFAANPGENWKAKDSAIYLVVALAPKAGTGGAASGYLVDVESFFTSVIVPELQGQDVNATPILKAGALKFFTVFREQIPKPAAIALLPNVIRFLGSESNVVHSYAANCIEKLLMVKDRAPAPAPGLNAVSFVPRYGASDINPIVQQLMHNLFTALQFPDSQENPYIMKCIMRVLGIAHVTGELAQACINHLASILAEVCKNPKNPTFNHYLFEAIAALVWRSCEKDQSLIGVFEGCLFQVLENILVNDISEFWPYAFQIFAELVEIRKPPLSDSYMQLFQVLLTPETWKKSANVPALVRLLQAYLQKVPNELNNEGRLGQVLGIFNKLISVSSTEELGFFVLNTVVENLHYDMIAPYIGTIWNVLFLRLQNKRTVKFVNSLVIFMSLVLVKHSPGILVDSINAVQANIFGAILQQFWIPNLKLISGAIEVKLTAVAATRLICESPSLLDASAMELWGKMLDSIITLLAQPDECKADLENDTPDIHETVGYSTAFARLHYAGKKEEDPLKEIRDPKEFLVTSLSKLSALAPGRYPAVIEKYVEPSNQAALLQICGAYNCAIV